MQVIVDKHTVTIIKNEIVNEGEYNVQSCNFQFSSDYDGLPKIAIFKTGTVTKQIMLSGNTCITPEEVLQTTGIVGLGVYAYQTDGDNLTLRYSPTPAVFTIEPGSYDEGDAPTPPTPSVIEQLQEEITQNANNITSLESVTATHTTQIGTLQTDVNNIKAEQITQNTNIQTNTNDISNIKAEQITQNNNIQANADDIATLQTSLSNETTNRENADINLQQQIDAITSSSDIVDIVGTYAQLQAYDTSHLSNNDVIKVLQDETHENAMTYYRWDKHNSQWIYIGQEAPYYTKSETDTLLQGKANANDVYTKSQIDDTLEDYALKTDITDFITEQEVDTKLEDYVETTTYTQGQATQDTNIQNNTDSIEDIELLIEQMPTVSGQGTDISLQDVYNYRLIKFLPQGNSSQFSTTGSNIIGLDNEQYHVNLRAGDKIVITNETDSTVTIDLFTNYGDTTRNDYWTITTAQSPRVITIANDSLAIKWHSVPNGKAWINLGETALPYEPYTGGVPAPSPSYPFPVKNVTGENSLVICNENLFNKNSITPNSYLDSDGNIITNITWSISDYIPVIAGEDYIYRWLTTVGNAPMSCYYDDNKNFVSSFKQTTYATKITIPTGVKYVRFTIEARNTNDLNTFMFVKGATVPTTYIANQTQTYQLSFGNMEFNSTPDGTIRDQIVGKPNEWCKREYIGKVVLDGSENWDYTNGVFNLSTTTRYLLSNWLCNALTFGGTATNTSTAYQNGNNKISANTSGSRLYIRIDDITSVSDFNTYLSSNNIIVNTPLAEYTDIPITDTTLINQLNNIYNNAHSYNGVTNITTTYEDGNEQMYLDVEALAKGGSTTTETDPTVPSYVKEITQQNITDWNDKQDELVSGTSIKTINNESILGSGNITISSGTTYTAGTNIEITNENVINNTIPFEKNSNGLIFGEKKVNTSLNTDTVAVGKNVTASGTQTVSIGNNSKTSSQFAISVGPYSAVDVDCGIAIGRNAQSHGINSIVIGESAVTYQRSSIALGRGANARQSNLLQIGSDNYPINKAQIYTSNGNKELATTDFLTTITGYDATKTQVLKNVNGTLTWVDE